MARPGTFTSETARIAAQASVNARKVAADYFAARPIVQPTPPTVTPTAMPADDYTVRRLKRVRDQLDRIDELAAKETDPKFLKEYADATTRLSEQERVLAGRPLPGSRRPKEDKEPRRTAQPAQPTTPACGIDTPTSGVPIAEEKDTTPQEEQGVEL